MISKDIETLLTIIFVHIDDWYRGKGQVLLQEKAGCKPKFSDSEVMTLMVAKKYIPYP